MPVRTPGTGPAVLVTAAFIGPGTVTVCTLAGVQFGYTLLWAVLFSTLATIGLQEMAARVGLVAGRGLTETIRAQLRNPVARGTAMILILGAVVVGNGAYEAGNVSGGGLGIAEFLPAGIVGDQRWGIANPVAVAVGLLVLALVSTGNYRLLERTLVLAVVVMSLSFLTAAAFTITSPGPVLQGAVVPTIPPGGAMTVLGVVGTTVVPYNLFLHASLVGKKWSGPEDLGRARLDTVVAIAIGGLVSASIMICGAAVRGLPVERAADLAGGLETVFGPAGRVLVAVGLAAAGITSAITAPMAAALVAAGVFGWPPDLRDVRLRLVAVAIVLVGTIVSAFSLRPIELIRFAQAANGLLLPVAAGFLLWVVNRTEVMGVWRNSRLLNVFGAIVLIVTVGLAVRTLTGLF